MSIRFSTFCEATVRIFGPRTSLSHAISAVRNGSVDGLMVDLVDANGEHVCSYEVQPCRPIIRWDADECF
jgi:hypothetical protein